jgi:hypothetical protein
MTITQCKAYAVLLSTFVDGGGVTVRRTDGGSYCVKAHLPSSGQTHYMHQPRHVAEFIRQYGR